LALVHGMDTAAERFEGLLSTAKDSPRAVSERVHDQIAIVSVY
jgi:hypothetical protein